MPPFTLPCCCCHLGDVIPGNASPGTAWRRRLKWLGTELSFCLTPPSDTFGNGSCGVICNPLVSIPVLEPRGDDPFCVMFGERRISFRVEVSTGDGSVGDATVSVTKAEDRRLQAETSGWDLSSEDSSPCGLYAHVMWVNEIRRR